MRIRYLKLQNWLLVGIMSLFGLQACHSQKNITIGDKEKQGTSNEPKPENVLYGGPEIDYVPEKNVLIKVVNEENKPDTVAVSQQPKEQTKVTPKPREPEVTVYGVPTVDFAVKGKVVDANGKPIKGLQVVFVNSRIDPDNLPDNEYWREMMKQMSDTTDQKGNFMVRCTDNPWMKQRVLVRDIDGAKNGKFEDQLIDVTFDEIEGSQSISQWKLGEKGAEITVKMKRKK